MLVKNTILQPYNSAEETSQDSLENWSWSTPPSQALEEEDPEISSKDIKNRIALLRSRFSLKWLINNGDTYLENQQLALALKSYLAAKEKNPKDKSVIKKIWDTYFEMHKFSIANTNYKALRWNESFIDDNRLILSYIYALPTKDDSPLNYTAIYEEIESFWLSSTQTFFYNNALTCIDSLDNCLEMFEKAIREWKASENNNLQEIAEAFKTFSWLQIEEDATYLKKTYLLGALFKAWLYPIVIKWWERILQEKPWYLPIVEMIAKWYFELWKYDKSKKYLLEYNKQDTLNPQINYMLGIVNIKLHEYILSNIYFIKAKKWWFTPVSMIYRRLIYNYYLVDNTDKMMDEFANLINTGDENLSEIDYSLWIYYSLINWKKAQANKWINKALKLYPEDDNFYGYKWWIYKEAWDIDSAKKYFNKWFSLNKNNPLINLNMWIMEAQQWNMLKAKIFFKNTIWQDPKWQFWDAASTELAKIQLQEQQNKKKTEEQLQEQFNQWDFSQ